VALVICVCGTGAANTGSPIFANVPVYRLPPVATKVAMRLPPVETTATPLMLLVDIDEPPMLQLPIAEAPALQPIPTETPPEPPAAETPSEQLLPESPPPPADSDVSQPLGSPPEDNRLLFLRSATVLLEPGQVQLDCGLDYTLWEDRHTLTTFSPPLNFLDTERWRNRELLVPLGARIGITKVLQAYINAPFGLGHLETANEVDDTESSTFGMGDVSGGLNCLLRDGRGVSADVIATVGFVAPTGALPFGASPRRPVLGDGFWSIGGSLLFVRTYDPVVLFYGVGYRHRYARGAFGGQIAPGDEVNYNFGLGFAVNDDVTLSTAVVGAFQTDTEFDAVSLPGTSQEPLSVRLAATVLAPHCRIIEPFVQIGLTEDAPVARLGVIVTRTF